ncbi:TolC family protein [Xylophilus rhododendri]|uniref:TolC family protein n=1 Tax=Xylophilus rhododendri TaxID=2697032 RepID=UPI001E3C7818|nr:TolC family protein [Xylophilus rhododendri]
MSHPRHPGRVRLRRASAVSAALILLFACAPSWAQDEAGFALGLDTAIARALDRNPEIAAARHEQQASEGALLQAGLRPNPEISALEEDLRRGRRTTTLQLSQPLELGGKRQARTSAAGLRRDQAVWALQQMRADVRAAVAVQFIELLAAQQRLRLAADSVALAESASRAARQRVAAGKVSPVEETRAQVAEAAARVESLQAEGGLRIARQRLAALWGDMPNAASAPLSAAGRLTLPPATLADASLQDRLADAPLLAQARIELDRRRALVQVETAARVPNVSVSVGAKRLQEAGVTQAVVGFSMPLPVFDRNQGNLAEALRREDKAHDELDAATLRLATELGQAQERLRSARAEARTLERDALPGARLAYDAAARGFALGKFSFLEALDAQRSWFQVQAQAQRALAESLRAATEIERLLGVSEERSELSNVLLP